MVQAPRSIRIGFRQDVISSLDRRPPHLSGDVSCVGTVTQCPGSVILTQALSAMSRVLWSPVWKGRVLFVDSASRMGRRMVMVRHADHAQRWQAWKRASKVAFLPLAALATSSVLPMAGVRFGHSLLDIKSQLTASGLALRSEVDRIHPEYTILPVLFLPTVGYLRLCDKTIQ